MRTGVRREVCDYPPSEADATDDFALPEGNTVTFEERMPTDAEPGQKPCYDFWPFRF